jgi:hypothetical protein
VWDAIRPVGEALPTAGCGSLDIRAFRLFELMGIFAMNGLDCLYIATSTSLWKLPLHRPVEVGCFFGNAIRSQDWDKVLQDCWLLRHVGQSKKGSHFHEMFASE